MWRIARGTAEGGRCRLARRRYLHRMASHASQAQQGNDGRSADEQVQSGSMPEEEGCGQGPGGWHAACKSAVANQTCLDNAYLNSRPFTLDPRGNMAADQLGTESPHCRLREYWRPPHGARQQRPARETVLEQGQALFWYLSRTTHTRAAKIGVLCGNGCEIWCHEAVSPILWRARFALGKID